MKLIALTFPEQKEPIAAIDASFMSKSGRKTDRLGSDHYGRAEEAQWDWKYRRSALPI